MFWAALGLIKHNRTWRHHWHEVYNCKDLGWNIADQEATLQLSHSLTLTLSLPLYEDNVVPVLPKPPTSFRRNNGILWYFAIKLSSVICLQSLVSLCSQSIPVSMRPVCSKTGLLLLLAGAIGAPAAPGAIEFDQVYSSQRTLVSKWPNLAKLSE